MAGWQAGLVVLVQSKECIDCQMLHAVPPDNLDHLGLLYAACNTLDSGRQLV